MANFLFMKHQLLANADVAMFPLPTGAVYGLAELQKKRILMFSLVFKLTSNW